jgi:hypothetical protein
LPAWLAVIEHEPPATIVTALPETVQTKVVVEAKLTANPELAVAPMGNGDTPYVTLPSAPNAIVCDGRAGIVTVLAEPTDRLTSVAPSDALAPVMATE